MRRLLQSSLLLFALAAVAAAQTPAPAGNLYRMGDRTVSIPPPEGFVEATSRSETVKKFFEATEAASLDLLAVHLSAGDMEKIARGEFSDLGFYTKVSVSKALRAAATSQQNFSELVAYLRANNAKVFDLKSPEMQSQLRQQNKGLSDLMKEDSRLDLSQPVNLGEIESTANSYGTLLLMKVKFSRGDKQAERMMVAGASAVRVGDRLVWIYTYKNFESEKDADALRAFTRRWLADIIRANP